MAVFIMATENSNEQYKSQDLDQNEVYSESFSENLNLRLTVIVIMLAITTVMVCICSAQGVALLGDVALLEWAWPC